MNPSQRQQPQLAEFSRQFNTLSRGRQVALVAGVLGLIASLFNWYGASESTPGFSASQSINGWHGWGYLAILGFLVGATLAVLTARGWSVRSLAPTLPPSITDARLVLGAGVVATLATLIFMRSEGSGVSAPGFSEGPSFGAYLGLLCAIAVAAGGYLMEREPGASPTAMTP